jgi:MFS family permease
MAEQSHHRAIFIASFLTLIAAGMGFAIRGKVLGDWGGQFGFTQFELGKITGGGLTGFGITIIVCSMFADRLGYKAILAGAFALHLISAAVTLSATPVFAMYGKMATYECLWWGMFLFALGNGLCEAAINPLVATIYPRQKTHYLNILHAGWPGGLIIGGLLAYFFVSEEAVLTRLRWEIPMGFFLVPTLIYGFITLKERFPISEARAAGVAFGEMLREFAAPVFLFLLLLHALVGYVELGTDSWITNIMEPVMGNAVLLLVYTSGIMFVLRFFAGPIVERINPLGLLFISSLFGVAGLLWLGSTANTTVVGIVAAATIYGIGKTFLWPTMLGVVGERFPKGGALTMGTVGGIGMLSAGLLGGPAIGYKQDYHASQELREKAPDTFNRYVSKDENSLYGVLPEISGLDGMKVSVLKDDGKDLAKQVASLKSIAKLDEKGVEQIQEVAAWWTDAEAYAAVDKPLVEEARIYGGRMALKLTAAVPAMMAIGYLLLILYFASKGGYRAVELDTTGHEHESSHRPSAAEAIYKDSVADQA